MIFSRSASGRLRSVRRGVYAVGGIELDEADDILGVVLAAGPGALASHGSAARLWQLPYGSDGRPEVTVPRGRQPRLPGAVVHRSRLLTPVDRTVVDGVPVTSMARTIVDLAGRLGDQQLAALLDEASRRGLSTPDRVEARSARLPIAPGRSPGRVARVVGDRRKTERAQESELERRVWRLVRKAGLPLPVAQHVVDLPSGRRRLDLAWPSQRVAVECDGFQWHKVRGRFDDDRVRQNDLVAAGWTVLRVTDAMTDAAILEVLRRCLCG